MQIGQTVKILRFVQRGPKITYLSNFQVDPNDPPRTIATYVPATVLERRGSSVLVELNDGSVEEVSQEHFLGRPQIIDQ